MWTFYLSVILLSVIQIQHVLTTGCSIASLTSDSASTLKVVWASYTGATYYVLDLRVVNSTTVAPVVVNQPAPDTQKLIQGLQPGSVYRVTLKIFQFQAELCKDVKVTMTVPGVSQITQSKAISSTAIQFQWSSVTGADNYTVSVESLLAPLVKFEQTFKSLSGQVDGLTPSTAYNCYVQATNMAGKGAKSSSKTITTLVQPPTGVALVSTGKSTARVTWTAVSKVLRYRVTVTDQDTSNSPVSSDTQLTSMDISGLEPCSTYTVGVSSLNSFQLPGEPANVTHTTSTINAVSTISADYNCTSGMVTVTWVSVFGANSYRATASDGSGAPLNCTSASTSCQITMLNCGTLYQIHVTAISDDCETTSTTPVSFDTVPCAPANLRTQHECNTNVIIFQWDHTNNTLYYVAKGVDNTGAVSDCMTVDNMCLFTGAACGQDYTYTVRAVTSECDSEVSWPVRVKTAPCQPTNVQRLDMCNTSMLITTWDPAPGALTYTIEAKGNLEGSFNCTTSTSSCGIAGVPCGEHLSIWISASNENCSTGQVLGQVAQSGPCTPTNISASVECSQDTARINWTTSIGAVFFIAVANDEDGYTYSCYSMDNYCEMDNLRCGQKYTARVIGTNIQCNSTASEEVTFATAPCPPTNIEAVRDCDANHALIRWQNHQPTGLYTARMDDQNGAQLTCTSDTVNYCNISSLPCGMSYSVAVTYDNGTCPSTSTTVNMDSVPCGPEDVTASVACVTGELTVTWNISVPASNYTTIISGGAGPSLYCNSTEESCTMGGLECGSSYGVTVYSVTGGCFSLPSAEVTVQTLACPPTNVTATYTCGPHPVAVAWAASNHANVYTAAARSSGGHKSECSTNQTSCSLPGLQCGEVYTIGVSVAADNCTGQQSSTVSLNTEPCAPTNVSSQLICSDGIARLSWAPSAHAVTYSVEATSNGVTLSCNSTSPNCTLSNLVCGEAYEIQVTASDGTCLSNYSAPFRQDPVPCPPQNISTNLLCSTNDLTVSWSPAAEPLNYSVYAEPLSGNASPVTCHTDGGSCSLSGLQCGWTYNVSVKASSGGCSGQYSSPQTVQTAPCPLQNLTVVADCGSDSLQASWSMSPGATTYTTTVTGPDGFHHNCSSSSLTCSVSGLQCGSRYNVTVTSQNDQCTSAASQAAVTTGPCDPVNVTTSLHCGSDVATVSWAAGAGAVAYTVVAQDDSSQGPISCRSNTTSCQLSQLRCGNVYNLTVVAEDATCNSTGGSKAVLTTAPCSPSIQNSTLICGTNSSSLSWESADAVGYIVNATATSGHKVSCTSTAATCTLTDLMCSETYTAAVTAQGSACDSAPGPSINITTAPCSPSVTSMDYTCGTSAAAVSWTQPAGSLSFLAHIAGDGYQDSCQTTSTSCVFHSLPCDLRLNVTVEAQGPQCNSTPSASESLDTVPCAPQNVSAALSCNNQSAVVTWVGSPSAVGYNVTLTGQDGHTHGCHTNTNSCDVLDVHCGDTYSVTVTPFSQTCTGNSSTVGNFKAGLCAPTNVNVSQVCGDNIVSWAPVTGAEAYIATATGDNGHTHTCSANYSSSCNFTELHCDEQYSVTVVTVDRGCRSAPSSAVTLRTALCPSSNLTGQMDCDANALTLTWNQSSLVGVMYSLQTERTGSALAPVVQTTPNTSYTLTNLLCGHRYAFRVATVDGDCQSTYSSPFEISTAPCRPTNFTVAVDCGTNRGNFSWVESAGATFYTVEVTGESGNVASCSSNDTSCSVTLQCGRSYNATLVASTETCNSTDHADILFDSAPCLPGDVLADVDCGTNVMNVSWTESVGSDDYTAWAISADGHRVSCNTTSTFCSIGDLRCGKVYEVAVTSSSIDCSVIAGSDYKVQSAPCKPENTTADQNCSSSIMTVTWSQNSRGHNYTATASSASGVNSSCVSADGSCSFLDLSCGQTYTFTVTGHTNVCVSEVSTPIEKMTAPCPPTSVSAELNCTTRTALVGWSSAAAGTGYSVQATSTGGHNSSCGHMGTSCELGSLVCGQNYSVVVEAMHSGCPGPVSSPVSFITEPCVPTNLSAHYNVSTAQVSWAAASGASSYSVEAVPDQGGTVSCNTTSNSCLLNSLQCSQIYNVTVTAHNPACDSLTSETLQLITEPCPPSNVQASIACDQLTATVSWNQSALAVGYVAYVDDQNGLSTSCVATGTQCTVSGLACGTEYSFWVKAVGEQYNSSDSTVVSSTSGPCQPSGIAAVMDCVAKHAIVSWQVGIGAVSYVAELTATSGHTTSCTTNNTNCQLSALQCGEEYNVSVVAVGESCNSTSQMAGDLATEPCVPTNLSAHYNLSTAQVTWATARGASLYSVTAVTDQGGTVTCNATSNSHCFLNGLQCGQIYNVTVMAQNLACNDTVSSDTYHLTTEPCPPNNVQAGMLCDQLSATVSWEQSDLAVGYVAYFDNNNGLFASCGATGTHCNVSGMACGTVYDVWVKALGEQYNSSDSAVVSLTSAPCLPTDVGVVVNCNTDGAAVVSWNSTHGTANFSLSAVVNGSVQTLCATQQSSCNVTDLTCGETYSLSLTATNAECSVTAAMPTNVTTRPCPPQRVAVTLQCGSSTAVLSWEEDSDVELYKATAVGALGGEVEKCNSTGSSCQLPGLACGQTYNLTVTAYSHGCCSQPSSTVSIQTEPCQPAIESVQALCQSEDVQISWNQTSGVDVYLITAKGNLGYVDGFNTTGTLLTATLPCGQDYNVTVRGRGSDCDSVPSSPAYFKTGPCVPQHVTTYVECEPNIGSVSWGPSDGASSYVAVATGLDGHDHQCLTNATSCTWSDLHCGENYTVVVRAKGGNCTSLPSSSSAIQMDPCVPLNLAASADCNTNVVTLTWDASNGTQEYSVNAEAGDITAELVTNVTTASFANLICGLNYSLTVTPRTSQCLGNSSAPTVIQTWPCPPSGISTTPDCVSGTVLVSWQPGNGSDHYTVTMQTDTGTPRVCTSASNQCSVTGLTCGYNFSVSVAASNQQCDANASEAVSVQSVPCPPTNVSVVMDCANNTALVSWPASRGALQYLVMAHGSHSNASCQTSGLSCSLDSLTCGSYYTVQVVAMDDNCSSTPSQDVILNSAPCPPQNVSVQFSCSSNNMAISWDAVRDADHFLVSVTEENGGPIESFNTTNTSCSLSDVSCGKTLLVQVTSVRGDCHSRSNQTHTVLSAPCQPQGVSGDLDCVTNSAWISWNASAGADAYTVSAVGGQGQTANCTTSTNTTCEVEDLACGELYNFSVTAKNSQCESQPSATVQLQTALCSLSAITAFPHCHNSAILVVWDLMEGSAGIEYNATAEASDRTYLSCTNTSTSCYLYGAQCGLHYTIIVAASSDQCSSMRSPPYRISMEPCPPQNVTLSSSCEEQSALVSWNPSPVAETYSVVAEGLNGHVQTCNTTSTNCTLSGLHCDQRYTLFVVASHQNCSSQASQNATLNTGPCEPDGVSVALHCKNQSALLSWTSSENAVGYHGCAQSADGDMLHCSSTQLSCTIEGLDCGTVYNFSVQASDGTCNSSFSDPVQMGAVPCPPDSIDVQFYPMQEEIQVLHFSWTAVSCEDTEYLVSVTGSLLGDNQALFELTSYWSNSTYFEFPLPCSSSYVATVQSRNSAGTSNHSAPLSGTTAPCPPSDVDYSGTNSLATVSWNASVFATAYTVYDNGVTPKLQLCRVVGLSCSFSNMTSSNLVMTASNAAGESETVTITNVVQGRRRRDLSEMQDDGL